MTIQHQTWQPDTCDCVIEEQYDDADPNSTPTLWFFHSVCSKHEPLVKNKPQINSNQLKTKREQIANHHRKLLDDNRVRHLKQFDENPLRKTKLQSIKDMMKSLVLEKYALKIQAQEEAERTRQENFLNSHEDKSMEYLLVGIHSPYAFNAQEVFDKIIEEQKQKNGG